MCYDFLVFPHILNGFLHNTKGPNKIPDHCLRQRDQFSDNEAQTGSIQGQTVLFLLYQFN